MSLALSPSHRRCVHDVPRLHQETAQDTREKQESYRPRAVGPRSILGVHLIKESSRQLTTVSPSHSGQQGVGKALGPEAGLQGKENLRGQRETSDPRDPTTPQPSQVPPTGVGAGAVKRPQCSWEHWSGEASAPLWGPGRKKAAAGSRTGRPRGR